jgi:hypothetical protein
VSDEQALIADLKAAEKAFVGRRIAAVTYYDVSAGSSGQWDFGSWHCPVMGVELVLDDGASYSVVWDCSFGNCSLHVYASPMKEHLLVDGDGSCTWWSAQDHDRWQHLLLAPIVDSRLIWHTDLTDWGRTAPAALRLTFPTGDVWFVVATHQPDDTWWIGADEVVVAFTHEKAMQIGVRDSG